MTINENYPHINAPAYVLEEKKLIKNLEMLREVRDEAGIEIILALKAVALWPVFPLIRQYLNGATASSLNEARLIKDHMGDRAHVYAPSYRSEEYELLAATAQSITFNSLSEYKRHYPSLKNLNSSLHFGLRVNPGYSEIDVALYDPAGPGSRLGIHTLTQLPSGITGLHFHALCENNSFTFERVLESFETRYQQFLPDLEWVNFGGGHLITEASYDIPHLISVLKKFKERYPHLKVIMEPGSAVAWQTGFLKTTVKDVIDTPDRKFLMLDISFTAHTPDCLEMPYNPAVRHAQFGTNGEHVYYLGGASCLAGDQLGPYSFKNKMQAGDHLILEDMIHYTLVKTTMFNGVQHPDIGMIDRADQYKVLRRFDYEDYKNRMG
ncbi:carboxynorspermidine decarboxylase [Membranicola marinus]|uniref:Carboxynorspermidine/carboxyspermidine decarboxylase n=1 Tax=Membranihabitans marinus TaxID=1227546 RepID=A0A953HZ78_9BACT|nr:carboxynorspermidine decarboxylase [Membranihabitans marinus]MBY5958412.1 carboxynorspermidine decarboxylase [Membranihabitans marinus]